MNQPETIQTTLEKLINIAPEYATNLLEEEEKDLFEATAFKIGYTVEEIIAPFVTTISLAEVEKNIDIKDQLKIYE